MQNKLLSQVERGNALTVKLREPLPKNSAWFVFQGVTSNGQGKPIFSKSFVVGKSLSGTSLGNLEEFSDFMNEYQLKNTSPEIEITKDELHQLESLLPDAVKSAKNLYIQQLQGSLGDELGDKLEHYEKNLNNWLQERQIQIKFDEHKGGIMAKSKDKRKQELESVRENLEKFYKQVFQLENDPFIRLLAVFFNAQ
jgi:hypothetical protein